VLVGQVGPEQLIRGHQPNRRHSGNVGGIGGHGKESAALVSTDPQTRLRRPGGRAYPLGNTHRRGIHAP
jgi:hypothetical protein